MFVYIGLTLLVVAIGFLVSNKQYGLEGTTAQCGMGRKVLSRKEAVDYGAIVMIFLALFAVSACRIGVGNDYWGYRENFKLIAQNREVSSEFGFNLVVKLCQAISLTDDNYLLIFGVFSFLTVFFFVKALYRQSNWFVFTLFLFMTSGFYFQSLNTVRYYFALAIAAFSMEYVIKKDWVRFVLFILLAACFHKSVLVVLLLYPLARYQWKKIHGILAAVVCVSLIVFKDLYREIVFLFYPYYENSVFDTGDTSIVNIAKCIAVLVLCLIFWKKAIRDNINNRFYFYLNLGALLLYVFASFLPEISRIGYYMTFSQVFLIPGVISKIDKGWVRKGITAGVVLCFCAYFALFLRGAEESIRILPYFNIIFD